MAGKYRNFRTDILTHEKTRGLHPLDRDVLLTQIIAANIAGILRRSVAQVANDAGGGTKPSHVRASFKRLEAAGVVRWWPKLDVIWAIEAADNQARGRKAWVAVANVIDVLPPEVQAEFRHHYEARYCNTPPDTPSDAGANTGNREQGKGNRAQGNASAQPSNLEPPPKSELTVVPDARRERDFALKRFQHMAQWSLTPPDGCGQFVCPPSFVYELIDQGQTPEDIVEVLQKAVGRINAGHLESRLWGAPLLKGWYVPIRDEQPIGGKGGAPSGPRIETVAEAEAYALEHGGALTGTGWGWELDGRGGQRAVRIGGAA